MKPDHDINRGNVLKDCLDTAALVTLCVVVGFCPTVTARVEQGCDFIQMAKTCFRLVYPNEGELVFRRLNKWIENIVNL